MKKLLLSFLVLGLFFAYSFHERSEESEAKIIPPNPEQKPQTENSTIVPTQNQTALPTQQIPSPTHSASSASNAANAGQASGYKDGEYTGNAADAFYGIIQVRAMISGGRIADIQFLQYPNDRDTSIEINQQAMPYLKQEAIQAQSANVDIISGATDTSQAFRESLQAALNQAKS